MFTVMVKWADANRAERLDAHGGTTTTRRIRATMFPSAEEAERVGRIATDGIEGIERWWVARF